jgi:deazaflavin-dependent oxidoreductase (nitroreductase family)
MGTSLRRVDATKPVGALRRALARATNNGLGRWIARTFFWRLDPWLLRISGGRLATTTLIVPTLALGTTGAKSGEPRNHAVIYFHDGDDVIVVASHAGAPTHPAWFHNLVAHPDVSVNGLPMRATVIADEAERARVWALADNVFPVFADYRAATSRTIPLVRLTERQR